MALRIASFGGGVQSTAMLALAAQGEIDYRLFAFANVGADSENPATLEYMERYAKPYAAAHGIELVEVAWVRRGGETVTLLEHLYRSERSIDIPVRMAGGAPGNRKCTQRFKIEPIAKLAKERGASPDQPAIVGLGISMDEFQRMRSGSGIAWTQLEYPLINLRLDRAQCQAIIERAGLPVPPKSSCVWCPFHSRRAWQELRQDQPVRFAEAVALETMLNARRHTLGKDDVFLHPALVPLERATSPHRQLELFGATEDACESGFCMV